MVVVRAITQALAIALAHGPTTARAYEFAWGFGGSSYQTEGAWNISKDVSVQDYFYHNIDTTSANADTTTDQYHRFRDDLALLPQLGATLYRFSVSWPRVLTGCTASVNQAGIDFYNALINETIANGAVPMLTMYHWDMPQACFDQYEGFATDGIIDSFLIYSDLLFKSFGDRVKYWLTVNEAESNCKFGFQQGRLAPGFKNSTYQATIDCVYRTHLLHGYVVQQARTNYDAVAKGWKFGFPSNVNWNEPAVQNSSDIAYADAQNLAYAGWYHDPLVFGTYQADTITAFIGNAGNQDAVGRAPPTFTADQQSLLAGTVDFISMNYYSTSGLPTSDELVPSGAGCGLENNCWQFPWAQGIRKMANWYYDRYKLDIIVTEVGFAAVGEVNMTVSEVVDEPTRLIFWQAHAAALAQAVEVDNVPVKGMLVWSLLDNFEWGYYDQKFGAVLVVGLGETGGSLERVVKNSTYWLADYYQQKNYTNGFINSTSAAIVVGSTATTSTSSHKSGAVGADVLSSAVAAVAAICLGEKEKTQNEISISKNVKMFKGLFGKKKAEENAAKGAPVPPPKGVSYAAVVAGTAKTPTASDHHNRNHRHDPDLHAVARGLRVPLTVWLVGYSTLSMLPQAVRNERLISRYQPGVFVTGLQRGELATTPLVVLSGVAAGHDLAVAEESSNASAVHVWAARAAAVVPAALSIVAGVGVTLLRGAGDRDQRHGFRAALLVGAAADLFFYALAPTAVRFLRSADRGAAPRLVVGAAAAAGLLSFGVASAVASPGAVAATSLAGGLASVALRFPAFFAGLALSAERLRETTPEKINNGPSVRNQVVGAVLSTAIWVALLFAPPSFSKNPLAARLVQAFSRPLAALASYLALRPIIAVPKHVSDKSQWRQSLYAVLSHPLFEAVANVALAAELVHREVINAVFYLARKNAWISAGHSSSDLTDGKVLSAWVVVVVLSVASGYLVHRLLQAPSLKLVKSWFEKKRDKLN
ncbi:hypothetical protein HK100_001298 [Physocladia obscura]|uniref:Glycoside hydrolase n=1 Tax=Physocladia obscura TaxID=109957 RepID=A0AAD5XEM2_9FUNG|nr:hypothetical protein HK100_001298 [Physocladia obscura]